VLIAIPDDGKEMVREDARDGDTLGVEVRLAAKANVPPELRLKQPSQRHAVLRVKSMAPRSPGETRE
jgi:hypothetical protein